MQRKIYVVVGLLALSVIPITSWSQEYFTKPDSSFKAIQPNASIQLWGVYSMHEQAQLIEGGALEPVDNRLSFMGRRARFGFKGQPYTGLHYTLTVHYDNLGKDKLNAARGSTNAGELGILDAYVSYQLTKKDQLWLTGGYFQPQGSREAITGDMLVNSFDKSVSQGYVRQHINGKGYGRSAGLNLGGILRHQQKPIQLEFHVGIFGNNASGTDTKRFPESSGIQWSPIITERIAISIGDPDKSKYSINYDANNFFNQRKGITIGGYHTQQGRSDVFQSNSTIGIDVLFNYNRWNFDTEINWLQRSKDGEDFHAQTGHIRLGYNVILGDKYFLEPMISWVKYKGDNGGQFSGEDEVFDLGVNWYINKKNCKIALHYIMQDGHGKNSYTDGVTFKKGDYIGLAFVLLM
jgi:hypothetical protein